MKKTKRQRKQPKFDVVRAGRRFVRIPRQRPIDADHPDYYAGHATVTFKMDTSRLRKEFGLDDGWDLITVDTSDRKVYRAGDASTWQSVTCIFEQRVSGPKRAMEILARGGELNQVWTNLIDNAIDALNGEGEIRLITRAENQFVMIEVADNGPGIAPETLPRLFEPFFTTKGVGTGTGLGLDITYRIIQQHNGSIDVQSRPGHTRFIIRLPIGTTHPTGA